MKMENNSLREKVDYIFVEHDAADFYSILLKTGKFAGVIYTYGKVSISEENDFAKLRFDFKVEDTSECAFSKEELETSIEFKNYIGDVLVNIFDDSKFQIGKNNGVKPSNNNLKKFNSQ